MTKAFACFEGKSRYKPASPLDPGRELNGRPSPKGPVGPHGPASRVPAFLRTSLPFPKGTRGLAPDGDNKGKAFHAIVRTRLSGAPGFERAGGRRDDDHPQGC